MSSYKLLSLAALAAPALAQQGAYFVLGGGGMPLSIERVDPIVSPGGQSGHVHSVVGGNGFSNTMDFAQTQKSDCSTVSPKADKSNYWMPNLYFQHPTNGSFIRVPEKPEHKIYYKYGKGDNTFDKDRTEFPKEFRMLAGDANLRSNNDTLLGTGGTQLKWMCHRSAEKGGDIDGGAAIPKGFTSCDQGFAAAMRLPSCWSGRDYDPEVPHMAYPLQGDGLAACPSGFDKARFPEIFVEYWFELASFDGLYGEKDSPFVLSNGDPTGYSFHMDFINGWEEGVLDSIMPTCNPGNTGNPPLSDASCFGKSGAGGTYTDDEMNNCRKKPTFSDDVGYTYGTTDAYRYDGSVATGGVLDKLPGCNPIQAGPEAAVKKTCGDEDSTPSSPSVSSSSSTAAASPTTNKASTNPTTLATSRITTSTPAASGDSSVSTTSTHVMPSPINPSHIQSYHSEPMTTATTPAAVEASAPVYSILPITEALPTTIVPPLVKVTDTFSLSPAPTPIEEEQDDCDAE